MFRLENLKAGYGKVEVLRGVSVEVPEGRITSVIGPNGAGKSTLIKSILGLADIMDGKIVYHGKDITRKRTEELVHMGISTVMEGGRVFPEMTVRDNLLMGAYPKRAREYAGKTILDVLEIFPNLIGKLHQKAGTLSGGERKALSIGMALMSKPELLILDEPSLGLHPKMVEGVFKAIKEVNKLGVTILLVEQNAYLSLRTSHTVFVLEGGRVTLKGTGKELLKNPSIKEAYLSI